MSCPFCGRPETARLDIEGHRFLVFECQFTPEVDPALTDLEIEERLSARFGTDGATHFRKMCDVLHVYVAKGEGARILTAPRARDRSGDPSGAPSRSVHDG
ncbi:MAG TPA: hypothetical protein VN842_03670 [Thermoplasmata archaeon]|nr:hypothetical protein [Thermoplasmata archaeon]